MPKRKLTQEPDSELSSPPADLDNSAAELVDNGVGDKPSKKRKTAQPARRQRKKVETQLEEVDGEAASNTPNKTTRRRKVKVEEEDIEAEAAGTDKVPKKRRQKKEEVKEEVEAVDENSEVVAKKVKRKRKTKEEKEAEAMPLAARTVGHKLFIGAHVSGAGGVHNAPLNSVHIGANAFALFLKSQRKWVNPQLQDDTATSFHANCKTHTYDQGQHVVPHGSYLVNLAHTDKARTEQAYEAFLDDLERCEKLGIKLYNFHPGNTANNDRAAAIEHLAKSVNRAHKATSTVVTLLENMAAGGNVLGSTFEDLSEIIALVEDKSRVGVCLDTCHTFAAGYDLRTPEAFKETMDLFDSTVGFRYLRALHVNDSKAPFASHRDLHANIGTGFLGLRAFHNLVNEPRFAGLPLVLETPIDVRDAEGNPVKDEKGKEKEDKGIWATEIKLLESLVGMDTESEEFLRLEKELARKGEPERKRLMEQQERKKEKDAKKAKSSRKKKGKKAAESEEDEPNGERSGSSLSELEESEGEANKL